MSVEDEGARAGGGGHAAIAAGSYGDTGAGEATVGATRWGASRGERRAREEILGVRRSGRSGGGADPPLRRGEARHALAALAMTPIEGSPGVGVDEGKDEKGGGRRNARCLYWRADDSGMASKHSQPPEWASNWA